MPGHDDQLSQSKIGSDLDQNHDFHAFEQRNRLRIACKRIVNHCFMFCEAFASVGELFPRPTQLEIPTGN